MDKQNDKTKLVPGVGRIPYPAYQGDEPYIFISYAHVDNKRVFAEIKRFNEAGYHVWYDEGIAPGNEWDDEIADALENCALFVVFLTKNSVKSKNVKNEIDFALDDGIPAIGIYLEPCELKRGLKLRFRHVQAILKHTISSEDEYVYRFTKAFAKYGIQSNLPILNMGFVNGNGFDEAVPAPVQNAVPNTESVGPSAKLRFDGVYRHIFNATRKSYYYLRFFPDGKVIEESYTCTPEQIIDRFNHDFPYYGTYTVENGIVKFDIETRYGKASFTGTIMKNGSISFLTNVKMCNQSFVTLLYSFCPVQSKKEPVSAVQATTPIQNNGEDDWSDLLSASPTPLSSFIIDEKGSISKFIGNEKIVIIPQGITQIQRHAFQQSSVTAVYIHNGISKIQSGAFGMARSLKNVRLPDGLKEISGSVFEGCHLLKSIDLKEGIKVIGTGAFAHCHQLKRVSLPDSVVEIKFLAFDDCSSLTEVMMGNNVKIIEEKAFIDNILLKKIHLSSCLEKILAGTFKNCTSLEEIEIPASVRTIADDAFTASGLKKLIVHKGSYAEQYAKDHNLYYEVID